MRRERLVVPSPLREPVFLAFHTSPSAGGHFNWRKTLAKVARKYYWPHMSEDIYLSVRACEACQRKRAQQLNRELLLPIKTSGVFEKVYVDLTGPIRTSASGNKFIIAMIDHFTKYVVAVPLPDCSAVSVAQAIMSECVLKFGAMTQLISDNASYFKGEVISELGRLLRISRYYTTPYHHEGNGVCERVFATFHPMLRTYINENQLDWDKYVSACTFMYNTTVHSSINNTPFFLMFGRDPIFNIDLMIQHDNERHIPTDADSSVYIESLVTTLHSAWKSASKFNERQRSRFKQQYDQTHFQPLQIKIGDRVFLKDFTPKQGLSSKLCNPWLGQFRVLDIDPPHLIVTSVSAPQAPPKRVHMNQVKKCFTLSGPVFTSPWLPDEEQQALSDAEATTVNITGRTYSTTVPDTIPHTCVNPTTIVRVHNIMDGLPEPDPPPPSDPLEAGKSLDNSVSLGRDPAVSSICSLPDAEAMDTTPPAGVNVDVSLAVHPSSPSHAAPSHPSLSSSVAELRDTSPSPMEICTFTTPPPSKETADDIESSALLAPASSSDPHQPPSTAEVGNVKPPVIASRPRSPFRTIGFPPRPSSLAAPSDSSVSSTCQHNRRPSPSPVRPARGTIHSTQPRGRGQPRRATSSRRGRVTRQRISPRPHAPPSGDLPQYTPQHYRHYLSGLHPWADFVAPRPIRLLREQMLRVQLDLPLDIYRQLPSSGYLSKKFTRSLFPKVKPHADLPSIPLPFIELQHLENTIAFRQRSASIISAVLAHTYDDVDLNDMAKTPDGQHSTVLFPPTWKGKRPVLYQVITTGWGTGAVLEAKDFFTVGPDRRDLHCITLDQHSLNLATGFRGFDKSIVSIKDFVWVYDVKPTKQALSDPDGALRLSRIPRTTALDHNSVYFFRVAAFTFVTPHQQDERVYGIVLTVNNRRSRGATFKAAFEGAPDAVTITGSICNFNIETVCEDDFITADSRFNVSCAMRFSEPPVSIMARDQLCHLVRQFLPMYPREGLLPLRVFTLPETDRLWLRDRAERFDSYHDNTDEARHKMSKLFSVACSALAAIHSMTDDTRPHWLTASVPNLSAYPIRVTFTLYGMPTEAGWAAHRPIALWVAGSPNLIHAKVHHVDARTHDKALNITIQAYPWSHATLLRYIHRFARNLDTTPFVDICVQLSRPPPTANPAYECVSRMPIYAQLSSSSMASTIVDTVYGRTALGCVNQNEASPFTPLTGDYTCIFRGRKLTLTDDQRDAVALGLSNLPIVAIQAAFGTGKTMVGALTAVTLVFSHHTCVVVTATTNAAVAQFTETVLSLDGADQLAIVRYVSDTATAENNTPTSVDLNVVLKNLGDNFRDRLDEDELNMCRDFKSGREVLEEYLNHPDKTLEMSEDEKEEYFISEKYVSDHLQRMVDLMFRLLKPEIVCATTASLLNLVSSGGLFAKHMSNFRVLIGDEASQIPEPVLAALTTTLPTLRHVYIGDVHQLEPHAKCHRSSNPVRFGARSVMNVLVQARAVPVAPLVTTFRVHPSLIELPNRVAYDGALVSGIQANQRQMLLSIMRFPNPSIPFMFVNVKGSSARAISKSHFNDTEADTCTHLLDLLVSRGISPANICVITFYKEQYRHLQPVTDDLGVELTTVDSVQGREKEVVILLTTRTDITTDSAEFLDDYRRMNVAISRCRQ
ncbi:integrase core domain protein, partial [Oesophagostomum dentatum]